MLKSVVNAAEKTASPLVPNIPEMILVCISFLVLLFLVYRFVVPNFEKTYQERKTAIQGGLEKAAAAQAQADAAKAQYTHQLQEVQVEANSIREDARAEAAQILQASRLQAQEEAQRISMQTQKRLQIEREVAHHQLRNELGTLAVTLAGKVVGEALTDDERSSRVVERFLKEIEGNKASA